MIDVENQSIYCDSCNELWHCHNSDTFEKIVQEAKKDGWKIKKIDDEWGHLCPTCQ